MDYCRDFKGETPLHLAAKDGYLEICQLMITYIENKSPKRNDGKTPGQLAHKKHCYSSYQDTQCMQTIRQSRGFMLEPPCGDTRQQI